MLLFLHKGGKGKGTSAGIIGVKPHIRTGVIKPRARYHFYGNCERDTLLKPLKDTVAIMTSASAIPSSSPSVMLLFFAAAVTAAA